MKLKMNNKIGERVYFLDSMRGILILLIVLLHVLQIYNPKKTWVIYTEEGMAIIPVIIDAIMLFVLPTFFIMSGYLAVMSITKMGIDKFFESKIKRILIPILMTALTFNSLQSYLLSRNGWMEFNLWAYIVNGQWISHLWFLIDLAIFFFILYISIRFFKKAIYKLLDVIYFYVDKLNIYFMILIIVIMVVIMLAGYSQLSVYIHNPIIGFRSLAFYFPFFFLGGIFFNNKNIFHDFLNINIFIIILLLGTSIFLSNYFLELEGLLYKLMYYFFDTFTYLFTSTICFYLFYKFLNFKSDILLFFANASYSIYLIHHSIVIALGLILINLNIVNISWLLLLYLLVILISVIIDYFIIQKVEILAFLFNGKKFKK
jgi:glucan biosynthesis protein C